MALHCKSSACKLFTLGLQAQSFSGMQFQPLSRVRPLDRMDPFSAAHPRAARAPGLAIGPSQQAASGLKERSKSGG